jgi:hypothetical protein
MGLLGMSPSSRVSQILPTNNSGIVTGNLLCSLDAGDPRSYPGSGTTWTDLSGRGKNATLAGSPQYLTDNGGCFRFTSASQYATLATPLLDQAATTSFAIEAWVRPTSFPNAINTIFATNSAGNAGMVALVVGSDGRFGININATPVTQYHQTVAVANNWYHVVISRHYGFGGSTPYYICRTTVNCVPSTNAYISDAAVPASVNPRIAGNPANSNYFAGDIAQLRIYTDLLVSNDMYKNFQYHKNRYGVV